MIFLIERTLVLLKPDAVQRGIVGQIITRFENAGLKIVGMKMVWANGDLAKKHYFDVAERHSEKILMALVKYLKEGPIIAMAVEGVSAISFVRKMAGSTYPNQAIPGSIRGDFAHISKDYANANDKKVGNLVHSSANSEEAKYEVELWFKPEELHTYKTVHEVHVM